jgi:hypothetical protein
MSSTERCTPLDAGALGGSDRRALPHRLFPDLAGEVPERDVERPGAAGVELMFEDRG